MVITSKILNRDLGIDEEIADFFANKRAVPANNRFWKNKRIYLSAGFGFLTIPIAFDLFFRKGIAKDVLLGDEHVTLMEDGFDRLKRFEILEISGDELIEECKKILSGKVRQQHLAADIFHLLSGKTPEHFQFETKYKALLRSDIFLLTLVDLDITDEWINDFLPYWYAAARPILLLDDFKDLEEDRRLNDENTIIEMGNDKQAILSAYQLGIDDLNLLAEVNPKLSAFIKKFLEDALNTQYIREQLTNQ
ncbi:hypothetical protein PDL71_05980 [Lacibacter sp. MH-610]|uniref:hypothetical protein n=1 Tax=Lacibacter sp. MH-610 TaxID=3020883 RepID=UPI0038913958